MPITVHSAFEIFTAIALLIAIRCVYIAATESDGPRKGRSRFIATFLFGFWFCAGTLLIFLYDRSLPVFEFTGTIESVQVRNSSSRHYSAYLRIQTTSGGDIDVHATDSSTRFRPGQLVKVRYKGDTGELISAVFYAEGGKQEGVLQSLKPIQEALGFLLGLFVIWVAFRQWRRDPEGAES